MTDQVPQTDISAILHLLRVAEGLAGLDHEPRRVEDQRIEPNFPAWRERFRDKRARDERVSNERAIGVLDALEQRWANDDGLLRSAVLDVADGDPARLLIAVTVWGAGPRGFNIGRHHKIIEQADRATEMTEPLWKGDLDAAWNAQRRLHGVGPAYTSKLLYFAGRLKPEATPQPAPLIYDRNVRAGLEAAGVEEPTPADRSLTASRYRAYLELCAQAAVAAGLGAEQADEVEYALFHAERTLRRHRLVTDGDAPNP